MLFIFEPHWLAIASLEYVYAIYFGTTASLRGQPNASLFASLWVYSVNVRRRRDIRLCNKEEKLLRYTSKDTFYGARKFVTNVVEVRLVKETIFLNKPVYIGMSVLDISKLEM